MKCGWCCTHFGLPLAALPYGTLWYNVSLGKKFPAIFPFEREVLTNLADEKDVKINIPIGEFWVEKKKKLMIVLDYFFANQICPFYDQKRFLCTIYDNRPVVCRMFPIVAFHAEPFKEPRVKVDVRNCPSATKIFGKDEKVVCPKGHTFSTIFGPYFQDAVLADLYMDSALLYVETLRKKRIMAFQGFKPKHVRRILRDESYQRLDFEDFFYSMEKREFRPFIKSVFLQKLSQDNRDIIQQGFVEAVVDIEYVKKWINKYW